MVTRHPSKCQLMFQNFLLKTKHDERKKHKQTMLWPVDRPAYHFNIFSILIFIENFYQRYKLMKMAHGKNCSLFMFTVWETLLGTFFMMFLKICWLESWVFVTVFLFPLFCFALFSFNAFAWSFLNICVIPSSHMSSILHNFFLSCDWMCVHKGHHRNSISWKLSMTKSDKVLWMNWKQTAKSFFFKEIFIWFFWEFI